MRRILRALTIIIAAAILLVFGMSGFVTMTTSKYIVGMDRGDGVDPAAIEACREIDPQCILVLGCAVWENNEPSPMLRERLDTAIALYRQGVAPKLLLSGDNSEKYYSEPDCMLAYTLKQGVPPEDIFLDFAGFSTYDSIYRAKSVFRADRMIVVTQKYHLFRALKISGDLGITARGVASNQEKHEGRYFREAREVLARCKDLVKGKMKPEPTFLGDEIPVDGDGTVTHVN